MKDDLINFVLLSALGISPGCALPILREETTFLIPISSHATAEGTKRTLFLEEKASPEISRW